MDKSAPSKESLERALKFNGHIECKCAVREGKPPCGFCRDMALEFDAIARERDEVTEKLKRELEKAEGQLDIILRECQGDDDASLANDYGGTGWEKEVPVATVRWHRNRWKKSNEAAEKLAEALEKLNGKIQTAGAERILATNFGELAIYFSGDEIRAMRKALAAYRERAGR